ncbi:hypothetical protein D0T50_10500 [Bacteroides sp. 214]|nr:hypothetical protein [Bacteroides sp. 214]
MLVSWAATFMLIPELTHNTDDTLLSAWIEQLHIPGWLNRLISLSIHLIIGYFLIAFNNAFVIIRIRASVQTTIYFLFIAIFPALHQFHSANVLTVFFIIALYFFFRSYQQSAPTGSLFYSFFFLGLGSMLFPQLIFFIPLFIIGIPYLSTLTWRIFFATLLGFILPYFFLLGHAVYHDSMELFYKPFVQLIHFDAIDFSLLPTWELVTLCYFFFLFVCSTIHCLAESYKDKIRTRILLRFWIVICFFMFVFIVLQPAHIISLTSILLTGLSVLIAHFATQTNSKLSNLFFIGSALALLFIYGYNIWMLL